MAYLFILFLVQNFLSALLQANAPPVLLIGVIYYALKEGWRTGLWLGLFAGFLVEMYGQGPLGFYMAEFALLGVVFGFLSTQLFGDSLWAQIFLPVAAVYLSSLAQIIYLEVTLERSVAWESFVIACRPRLMMLSALFSPALFFCLKKISPRVLWRP